MTEQLESFTKINEHSMLLCQVPSCLVLVRLGVCAQRLCVCSCLCRYVRLYSINVLGTERCCVCMCVSVFCVCVYLFVPFAHQS